MKIQGPISRQHRLAPYSNANIVQYQFAYFGNFAVSVFREATQGTPPSKAREASRPMALN
jgi:hypothetical protein